MSGLVLLSVVILVTGLPGTWIQAIRVIRRQTTAGLSCTYFLVTLVSAVAWMTYGLLTNHGTQLLTSGSAVIANLIVAGVMWRLRTLSPMSVVVAMACLASISIAGLTGGALALGLVASTIDVGGRLPQAWKALTEPGGEGVSVLNFAVNATNAVAWIAYGVFHGDLIIAASSFYCFAVNVFVAWRTYAARQESSTPELVPAPI